MCIYMYMYICVYIYMYLYCVYMYATRKEPYVHPYHGLTIVMPWSSRTRVYVISLATPSPKEEGILLMEAPILKGNTYLEWGMFIPKNTGNNRNARQLSRQLFQLIFSCWPPQAPSPTPSAGSPKSRSNYVSRTFEPTQLAAHTWSKRANAASVRRPDSDFLRCLQAVHTMG